MGSTTVFIHDPSRPFDKVGGVENGVRTLITEIWYPANVEDSAQLRRASYGDYSFGDMSVHRRMLTGTSFQHLTPQSVRDGVSQKQIEAAIAELFERERGSFVDAPAAATAQPFPAIVMSHGDGGSRYNMQSVCEYLAAHGYVVIAPEHTGNSPYSLIGRDPQPPAANSAVLPLLDASGVYAHDKPLGQTYVPAASGLADPAAITQLDAAVVERVNDLRAALAQLAAMNTRGPLAGKIDLQRVGLLGRSFGGLTTLAGLQLEDRFAAGMAVVPPYIPDVRPMLPVEMLKAAGQESALLGSDGPALFTRLNKPTLLLSGAEDRLIIGMGKIMLAQAGLPAPTVDNPHPLLRQLFEQSTQAVFWGVLANTNHASLGVAGPYWWPQLKPDRLPRALRPEEDFQLLDAGLAHRIQKERALLFFDTFIKGDAAARTALADNPFAGQGLLWETRNL